MSLSTCLFTQVLPLLWSLLGLLRTTQTPHFFHIPLWIIFWDLLDPKKQDKSRQPNFLTQLFSFWRQSCAAKFSCIPPASAHSSPHTLTHSPPSSTGLHTQWVIKTTWMMDPCSHLSCCTTITLFHQQVALLSTFRHSSSRAAIFNWRAYWCVARKNVF